MKHIIVPAIFYLFTLGLFYKMMKIQMDKTAYIQTPSDYQIIYNEDSVDVYYYGKYLGGVPRPVNTALDTLILNDQNLER